MILTKIEHFRFMIILKNISNVSMGNFEGFIIFLNAVAISKKCCSWIYVLFLDVIILLILLIYNLYGVSFRFS